MKLVQRVNLLQKVMYFNNTNKCWFLLNTVHCFYLQNIWNYKLNINHYNIIYWFIIYNCSESLMVLTSRRGGGALKYNSVHMHDQKNVWKGYFFTGRHVTRYGCQKQYFWKKMVLLKFVFHVERVLFSSRFICEWSPQ